MSQLLIKNNKVALGDFKEIQEAATVDHNSNTVIVTFASQKLDVEKIFSPETDLLEQLTVTVNASEVPQKIFYKKIYHVNVLEENSFALLALCDVEKYSTRKQMEDTLSNNRERIQGGLIVPVQSGECSITVESNEENLAVIVKINFKNNSRILKF